MSGLTLILGLGGTGGDIANEFARLIKGRIATEGSIKTIAIDTEMEKVNALTHVDVRIPLSEPSGVSMDDLIRKTDWFPFNKWDRGGGGAPAGLKRPIGAFLVREITDNQRAIRANIDGLVQDLIESYGEIDDFVNVWMISSSGGGSGSGMFCDVAKLVRDVLKSYSLMINGILLTPTGLGFASAEAGGLSNSYALLNEIDFLISEEKKKGQDIFKTIFLMGLPRGKKTVKTAFDSAKSLVPSIIEAILYGQVTVKPDVDDANIKPIIDWGNFDTAVNAAAGKYYTFGYSELVFDWGKCSQYCQLKSDIDKLKTKIAKEIPEFAEKLRTQIEGIPDLKEIHELFLEEQEENTQKMFDGNLHYKISYFEEINRKFDEKLKAAEEEKKSLASEITDLTEGTKNAQKQISVHNNNWKKIFEDENLDNRELGVKKLEEAKKDLSRFKEKIGLNRGLIRTISDAIRALNEELTSKKRDKEDEENIIEDFTATNELVRAYISEIRGKIADIDELIKTKGDELSKISLEEKIGYIKSYPDFKKIKMGKREFLDRMYEISQNENIEDFTLSTIITKVENDRALEDYAKDRARRLKLNFARFVIPAEEGRQNHPFVWHIVACQDEEIVLGKMRGDLDSAEAVDNPAIIGLEANKTDFHKTRWQFVKLVGGEPLETFEELKELKKEYEKNRNKQELHCYPEVFKKLNPLASTSARVNSGDNTIPV